MAIEIIWKDRKRTFCGLPWSFTKYSLSEDRIFVERGFFKTIEDETRLYRILDLKLERSFVQKIFGIGSVVVTSSDRNLGTFVLKNIKNAKEVKEQIADLVEKQRDAKRVVSREFMDDDYTDDEEEI